MKGLGVGTWGAGFGVIYLRLDTDKKAVIKCGMTTQDFFRIENYDSYYPLGVYMRSFLFEPC